MDLTWGIVHDGGENVKSGAAGREIKVWKKFRFLPFHPDEISGTIGENGRPALPRRPGRNGRRGRLKRRIFLFHTLTLVAALVILLAVSGGVVRWVMDAYQRQDTPSRRPQNMEQARPGNR